MSAPVTNLVEQIRAVLGPGGKGWYKGGMHGPDGRSCLLGAAALASAMKAECILDSVIREQYPDRCVPWTISAIPRFNDHPDTVWADVELVLDKASVRWEVQA